MKKYKIIFILILIITCTGCSVEYNINITDDDIKETINITDYVSDNRSENQILNHYNKWYPTFVNYIKEGETIELTDYNKKYDGIEYHKKEITTLNNGYKYSYNYDYGIEDYHDAYSLAVAFSNTTIYKRYDTLVLKTSKESFLCNYSYFEDAKINISIDPKIYRLNYTNAHTQSNNIYTWHLNKNNCKNSEIILTLDIISNNNTNDISNIESSSNNKQEKKENNSIEGYSIYILLIITLLIVYFGYQWFMKFKEKNNDID